MCLPLRPPRGRLLRPAPCGLPRWPARLPPRSRVPANSSTAASCGQYPHARIDSARKIVSLRRFPQASLPKRPIPSAGPVPKATNVVLPRHQRSFRLRDATCLPEQAPHPDGLAPRTVGRPRPLCLRLGSAVRALACGRCRGLRAKKGRRRWPRTWRPAYKPARCSWQIGFRQS